MWVWVRLGVTAFLLALVAGCSTLSPENIGGKCWLPPVSPPYSDTRYLDADTQISRQGSIIKVIPRRDMRPAGVEDIAIDCLRGWSVQGPARFDRRSGTLTIAPDAPIGAEVKVSAGLGSERLTRTFRVISRDAIVLTGRRSQRSVTGCESADPVRELEFNAEGGFSVTFNPFESYRDYWGSYTYDEATRVLTMRVKGGNFVPPKLDLEGRAYLDPEGRLVVEDVHFGGRGFTPAGQACRYVF